MLASARIGSYPSPTVTAAILALLCSAVLSPSIATPLSRRDAVPYYSPLAQPGGQMLTIIPGGSAAGLGEPINVIVSGASSPSVLSVEGFFLWVTSINFGVSCLGQGLGDGNSTGQQANLGDGRGNVTQGNDGTGDNGVMRYNYMMPYVGTCKQTFAGGNHFRWWQQIGDLADSKAFFLATSNEESLDLGHMIQRNGYNMGRDELVGNATLSNGTRWDYHTYNTTVTWIEAGVLLNATSEGVNHPDIALPGQPNQDGRVALLTVTETTPPGADSSSAPRLSASVLTVLCTLFGLALLSLL